MRPVRDTVLMTATKGPSRVIFKRKVEQFSEKHSRAPGGPLLDRSRGLVDSAEVMRLEMVALVNHQRAVNAVSKCGRPDTEEGWSKISELMAQDVLAVLREEQAPMWFEHEAKHLGELRMECDRAVQEYRSEVA